MLGRRAVLLPMLLLCTSCGGTSKGFQQDADVIRLRHLKYYAELIEEYKAKTGHYPLEAEESVPVWVYVAHDRQIQYTEPGPDYEHVRVPFTELVSELESVLDREIAEYYDPQYAPDGKPNFYTYLVGEDIYYFTIHVNEAFPFAHRVSSGYYRVVVSNRAKDQNQALVPSILFPRENFRSVLARPVIKQEFFDEREEQYLHHTKEHPVVGRERRGGV